MTKWKRAFRGDGWRFDLPDGRGRINVHKWDHDLYHWSFDDFDRGLVTLRGDANTLAQAKVDALVNVGVSDYA